MYFVTQKKLRKYLLHKEGVMELICNKPPISGSDGVSGEWQIFYLPNGTKDRLPLITSSPDPKIRILTKLHGVFMLLVTTGVSPVSIPIMVGRSCSFDTVLSDDEMSR